MTIYISRCFIQFESTVHKYKNIIEYNVNYFINITFTFMHLADTFIKSDLKNIQAIHFLSVCVFPGNLTHNLCAANTMLNQWATGTLIITLWNNYNLCVFVIIFGIQKYT